MNDNTAKLQLVNYRAGNIRSHKDVTKSMKDVTKPAEGVTKPTEDITRPIRDFELTSSHITVYLESDINPLGESLTLSLNGFEALSATVTEIEYNSEENKVTVGIRNIFEIFYEKKISARVNICGHELFCQIANLNEFCTEEAVFDKNDALESAKAAEFEEISKYEFYSIISENRKNNAKIFCSPPFIDWNDPLFQRPHQLALASAQEDSCFIYCTPNWRHDSYNGYFRHRTNSKLIVTSEWSEIKTIPGIWLFVCSTNVTISKEDLIELKGNGVRIIYDYIDHIGPEVSSTWASELIDRHNWLTTKNVDAWVASASSLYEELENKVPSELLTLVQNGVDVNHFQNSTMLEDSRIQKIECKRNEYDHVVGFFGAIAPWLDYDSLNHAIDNMSDCLFVIIGPDYDNMCVSQIHNRHNVLLIGAVDYRWLPSFCQHFETAIIPFLPGEVAKTTSPLKLFEYFALGLPVVVEQDMRECVVYDHVFAFRGKENFVSTLKDTLAKKGSKELRDAALHEANLNTWKVRFNSLLVGLEKADEFSNILLKSKIAIDQRGILRGARNLFGLNDVLGVACELYPARTKATITNGTPLKGDFIEFSFPNIPEKSIILQFNLRNVENPTLKDYFQLQYLVNGQVAAVETLGMNPAYREVIFKLPAKLANKFSLRLMCLTDCPDWKLNEAATIEILDSSFSVIKNELRHVSYYFSSPHVRRSPLSSYKSEFFLDETCS